MCLFNTLHRLESSQVSIRKLLQTLRGSFLKNKEGQQYNSVKNCLKRIIKPFHHLTRQVSDKCVLNPFHFLSCVSSAHINNFLSLKLAHTPRWIENILENGSSGRILDSGIYSYPGFESRMFLLILFA